MSEQLKSLIPLVVLFGHFAWMCYVAILLSRIDDNKKDIETLLENEKRLKEQLESRSASVENLRQKMYRLEQEEQKERDKRINKFAENAIITELKRSLFNSKEERIQQAEVYSKQIDAITAENAQLREEVIQKIKQINELQQFIIQTNKKQTT